MYSMVFQEMKKQGDKYAPGLTRTAECDEFTKEYVDNELIINLFKDQCHIRQIIIAKRSETKHTNVYIENGEGKTIGHF